MAHQSSSSSSTSQQFPNSNPSKSIETVNQSKDDLVRGSKVQEHNFFSPIQVGSSSYFPNNNNEGKDENNNEKKNSESKFYSCNYCKGQYSSLQALGGHQNAHKAERALQKQQIKQKYEGDNLDLGQPSFNPYLNYPNTSFTPYNYRPLGIRMESMIQKSPYINPKIGHGAFTPYRPLGVRMESMIHKSPYISPRVGHGSLCLHDILHPSLASFRNHFQGSNGGVASLGIGGTNNPNAAILKFGESSTNNVALNSTMDDIPNSNIEEEPSDDSESSGLDLSLKL
ncbi:hypothetical protein TSUD_172370 [Trifolium subterraneum]|uniref:C2H2-type domain-containing protein n=1 Tax=Trifolium subterraneum TaxID=3900 RepID=A0A2Z6MW31_TRISU|nr:hypothetical protein TSUD_172370 [Trifolium subterraneum]